MGKYVPEPTPVSDNLGELQRYIDVELRRISDALNVKVDGAYGGIFQSPGVFVISPLTPAPVLFDPFDILTHEKLDGVEGLPASGSLIILTAGSFMVQFATTIVNILPNAEYGFLLALNGVSTGLGGVVNPSNQTDTVTLGFNILITLAKGDVLTMLVNSDSSNDLSVINSEFITNRVSEEFD